MHSELQLYPPGLNYLSAVFSVVILSHFVQNVKQVLAAVHSCHMDYAFQFD